MNEIHEFIQDAAAKNGLEVTDCEAIHEHYKKMYGSFNAWKEEMVSDMKCVAAYCKAFKKPPMFNEENLTKSWDAFVLETLEYENPTPRQLAMEFFDQDCFGETIFPSRLSPFITIDYDALGKYIMEHYKVSGDFVFEG